MMPERVQPRSCRVWAEVDAYITSRGPRPPLVGPDITTRGPKLRTWTLYGPKIAPEPRTLGPTLAALYRPLPPSPVHLFSSSSTFSTLFSIPVCQNTHNGRRGGGIPHIRAQSPAQCRPVGTHFAPDPWLGHHLPGPPAKSHHYHLKHHHSRNIRSIARFRRPAPSPVV